MQKIHAIIKSVNDDELFLGFDIDLAMSWQYNFIDVKENLKSQFNIVFCNK
jgi:hypothetical protein